MRPRATLAVIVAALSCLAAASASSIQVKHPWIRTPPPGAVTAAGYVTLTNQAAQTDHLVGASSPAAQGVSAHDEVMAGGMMRMTAIASLPLEPGRAVSFAPGGYHLMLTGLKGPLKTGQKVPVTLRFQRAGAIQLMFVVEQPAGPVMP